MRKKTSKAKKAAPKAVARRVKPKPKAKAKAAPKHVPTPGLYGWITHTDLASLNPLATKAWCLKVLGWHFRPSFPGPAGDIHLFAYSDQGGGGIRPISPPEVPGSLPYIHVKDCQASFDLAIAEGATVMMPPTRVMAGVTVAIVKAPGGVPIGFSGP